MSGAPRRSGRTRKASARNVNDGWNKETLRLLRESSESSNPTSPDTEVETTHHDDEFALQDDHHESVNGEAEAEQDDLSVASGSSKSSQVATPRDEVDEDGMELIGSEGDGGTAMVKNSKAKHTNQTHSRGILMVERGKSAKGGVWQSMFGPDIKDLRPMLEAKERWLFLARDVTLPSWTTVHHAMVEEWSGLGRKIPTQTENNDQIPPEAVAQQVLRRISFEDTKTRHHIVNGNDHKIVLGPWQQQESYDLPYMTTASLGQAWHKDQRSSDASLHSGWLLNIGEKPQCMAWSPCQVQGQYLALASRSTPYQRSIVPKIEVNTSPAFSPSALFPTSIQIWRFATLAGSATTSSMSYSESPELFEILACNFGDVKQMEWAVGMPLTRENEKESSLGILTLLTTDGAIRLLQVPRVASTATEPSCYEIVKPAIQISPPEGSIFTCFTYASPTDLILGSSTGHIHIYNLSQQPKLSDDLEPYLSLQAHHTYVMSVKTLEDDYSHFMVSTSAAGTIQLTDLRCPTQDTLTIPRARIPTRNLISSPHSHAFITSIDSSGNTEPRGNAQTTIVAHHLRHFYATTALSKFPEGSGTSSALAGSPLHPYILMGNTGGAVWAQNIIRRILPTGKPNAKNDGGAWVQKVVEYEWIPQQPPKATTDEKADFYHGPPVRQGISRMHHAFKPEKLDLSNVGSRKRKVATSGPYGESAVQVIFEEEQAVTCIVWNGNPEAATWCAIGWGSGVVLVQDLGHDAV